MMFVRSARLAVSLAFIAAAAAGQSREDHYGKYQPVAFDTIGDSWKAFDPLIGGTSWAFNRVFRVDLTPDAYGLPPILERVRSHGYPWDSLSFLYEGQQNPVLVSTGGSDYLLQPPARVVSITFDYRSYFSQVSLIDLICASSTRHAYIQAHTAFRRANGDPGVQGGEFFEIRSRAELGDLHAIVWAWPALLSPFGQPNWQGRFLLDPLNPLPIHSRSLGLTSPADWSFHVAYPWDMNFAGVSVWVQVMTLSSQGTIYWSRPLKLEF